MPKRRTSAGHAFTDRRLSMPARTVLAWIQTNGMESVTIGDVAETMDLCRASAGTHLSALENTDHLVRFLPNGGKAEHHWRLASKD